MDFTEFCLDQVERMAVLNYYPRGDDRAINELVSALERSCGGDRYVAAAVISDIIATSTERPTPKEISDAAWFKQHPDGQSPIGDVACAQCRGMGFVIRKAVVKRGPLAGQELEGAEPCQCRKKAQVPA